MQPGVKSPVKVRVKYSGARGSVVGAAVVSGTVVSGTAASVAEVEGGAWMACSGFRVIM